MKRWLCFFALLVTAFILVVPSVVSAQSTTDTVFIPGAQSLNISNIINADTSVTAPRVYVLDRGAIYYIEKAFEITHSSKFIAKGTASRPPVLAPAIRADDSAEEWFFKLIKKGIKVELSDLYLLSMRSDKKTLGWSRAIHIGADSISLKLRRVVFDAWTEAGIRVDGADYVKLDVQDCHFRNFIHSTSYFGGQPFLSGGGPDQPDTTIFMNNTFFACNSYLFSVRGLGPKNVFSHNTVVYGAVNPMLVRQADNFILKNNLFYASHAWGGDPEQVIQGWFFNYPDTVSSGILQLRKQMTYHGYATSGPEAFNDASVGLVFNPSRRTFVAQNNAYFFPNKLVKFYNDWNDTVTVFDSVEVVTGPKQFLKRKLTLARWLNDMGIEILDSLTNSSSWDYSPNVSVVNNINADPVFSDAGVVGHVDSLINYVKRIATRTLDNPWHYQLNFPPAWPIPENLGYTNTTLQSGGTDGFALGDLNWFPTQKQQWLVTGVKSKENSVPSNFSLSQNYPNPFNPNTTINYQITKTGLTTLKVYNLVGQEVATLVNGVVEAGSYKVSFDAAQLSTGVYFYTLHSGNFVETKKMILVK